MQQANHPSSSTRCPRDLIDLTPHRRPRTSRGRRCLIRVPAIMAVTLRNTLCVSGSVRIRVTQS